MRGSRAGALLRRDRKAARVRRSGAVVITVLAVSDVAYRLLMREPLRRALGVEHRPA